MKTLLPSASARTAPAMVANILQTDAILGDVLRTAQLKKLAIVFVKADREDNENYYDPRHRRRHRYHLTAFQHLRAAKTAGKVFS